MDELNLSELASDLLGGRGSCRVADRESDPGTTAAAFTESAAASATVSGSGSSSLESPPQPAQPQPRALRVTSSRSPPTQHMRTTSWSAPLLKDHTRAIPMEQESCHHRTVISACTGCFAEAEVLKAGLRVMYVCGYRPVWVHRARVGR